MKLARYSCQKSESGYYHIILRGVNRQDIFFDEEDREKMLDTLKRFQQETEIIISAWCLMSNHIHLLVKASEKLDLFVKKIASSYVYYFNRKYDRVGHLFQDRYRSEPVDSDAYLLTVFRYILQNPAKAGIGKTDAYPWNSWKTVEGRETFCDIAQILAIVGDWQTLRDYVLQQNEDQCLEAEGVQAHSEAEALEVALRITGGDNPLNIALQSKEERDEVIAKMKAAGISIRQISRLTGINRNIIQRA